MLIDLITLINTYNICFTGILHVGAHECEELPLYEQFLSRDKILWIEAMPHKVNENKHNFENLLIENAVVSDAIETIKFYVSNNGQSSSILEMGTHSTHYPQIQYIGYFEQQTIQTIEIVNKYKNIAFNFLNIDVQGAELKVLKGLGDYLNEVDYIYVEVNVEEVYKNCCLLEDLDKYLLSYSFVRVEIKMTDQGWGDAFYIKKSLMRNLTMYLEGGLGNRLFQMAAGYSLAKKYKRSFNYCEYSKNEHSSLNYSKTIFKNFQQIPTVNSGILISEPDNHDFHHISHDIIDTINNDVVLRGCYQNESYFAECKNEFINLLDLTIDENILSKYGDLNDKYFIHVRRGDYLKYDFFNINLSNYYKTCLNQLNDEQFILFSNDLEWCKNNELFKNLNITFCDEDELASIYIMSKCKKGGICANSSFSWWGAYLNTNSNKQIYIPNKWFSAFKNIINLPNAQIVAI